MALYRDKQTEYGMVLEKEDRGGWEEGNKWMDGKMER